MTLLGLFLFVVLFGTALAALNDAGVAIAKRVRRED